jgi:hypothetical protein
MRTYWRQRNDLVRAAGRHIQLMQKALTQMNIQLANAINDASGMTGHERRSRATYSSTGISLRDASVFWGPDVLVYQGSGSH